MPKDLKFKIYSYKNLGKLWLELIGNPDLFPLEARIFHSICFIVIAVMIYYIPFNFLLGATLTACFTIITLFFMCLTCYRSRVKMRFKDNDILVGVLANTYIIIDYIYNSGISGPTNILATVALMCVIALSSYKRHFMWLSCCMLILIGLNVISFYYPSLIHYHNNSRTGYFIDQTVAYLIAVILFFYTIKFILLNYDYERQRAEEKTQTINDQSHYIQLQNSQLEYLNSEKNKLMSIIAHDLRAPLANIENYLELVNEYAVEDDERMLIENDLLKATENTIDMLSDLLVWSNSQMEGPVTILNNINVSSVLKNTLEMEKMHAFKKNINLEWIIDPDMDIVADNNMLQLVVRNLISNAIKFTPMHGAIEVSGKKVNNECMITIKDNGNGIPYLQQPNIFSFKAASTYGTNNEKGVGLGLLLCKDFTEKQGGRIGFESVPGQGSSFFIYIPLHSATTE